MKRIIILIIVVIILLFGFIFFGKNQKIMRQNNTKFSIMPNKSREKITIKIRDMVFNVEIADTNAERMLGLSGKEELEEGGGMLFVFKKEGYYGIWMKDMKFSIDVAWLDKDKKIIYIENAVRPETYPKIFYAQKNGTPAINMYVLETNAGFFDNSKIKIGDAAEF